MTRHYVSFPGDCHYTAPMILQRIASALRRQILADLDQVHWDLSGRRTYNAQALAFGEQTLELISGGLPRYRELIRERLPWAIQSHIWDANCLSENIAEGRADYRFELVRCEPPDDRALIHEAALKLRSDAAPGPVARTPDAAEGIRGEYQSPGRAGRQCHAGARGLVVSA